MKGDKDDKGNVQTANETTLKRAQTENETTIKRTKTHLPNQLKHTKINSEYTKDDANQLQVDTPILSEEKSLEDTKEGLNVYDDTMNRIMTMFQTGDKKSNNNDNEENSRTVNCGDVTIQRKIQFPNATRIKIKIACAIFGLTTIIALISVIIQLSSQNNQNIIITICLCISLVLLIIVWLFGFNVRKSISAHLKFLKKKAKIATERSQTHNYFSGTNSLHSYGMPINGHSVNDSDDENDEKNLKHLSLLDAFMSGNLQYELESLDTSKTRELSELLPIIAQTIANLPFGLTSFRFALAAKFATRIIDDPSLEQAWRFFLCSSGSIHTIKNTWSNDFSFGPQRDNDFTDPAFTFEWIYKEMCNGKKIIIPPNNSQLYDPVTCKKIKSIKLKKILPSNAKPLLIQFYGESNEIDDEKDDKTNNEQKESGFPLSKCLLKQGDDLRKDCGVTLMFRIMNQIWLDNNLYYHKSKIEAITYQCFPITDNFGLIEWIGGCIPVSSINHIPLVDSQMSKILGKEKFESIKARPDGADSPRERTETNAGEETKRGRTDRFKNLLTNEERKFRDNLLATAAGSYIGAYILGARDRHHENILINKENGKLFHIDYGYVLGEQLSGANIDAAPIAITNDLFRFISPTNTIDDAEWIDFVAAACNAYEALRHSSMQLLDYVRIAFPFMKCMDAGIDPETFLKNSLRLNLSTDQAIQEMIRELDNASTAVQTGLKNFVHVQAKNIRKIVGDVKNVKLVKF